MHWTIPNLVYSVPEPFVQWIRTVNSYRVHSYPEPFHPFLLWTIRTLDYSDPWVGYTIELSRIWYSLWLLIVQGTNSLLLVQHRLVPSGDYDHTAPREYTFYVIDLLIDRLWVRMVEGTNSPGYELSLKLCNKPIAMDSPKSCKIKPMPLYKCLNQFKFKVLILIIACSIPLIDLITIYVSHTAIIGPRWKFC